MSHNILGKEKAELGNSASRRAGTAVKTLVAGVVLEVSIESLLCLLPMTVTLEPQAFGEDRRLGLSTARCAYDTRATYERGDDYSGRTRDLINSIHDSSLVTTIGHI